MEINAHAFDHDGKHGKKDERTQNIASITIPKNVTRIDESAFHDVAEQTIRIDGNSLKIIEKNAFAYNNFLTEIILPPSVTSIGENAFGDCSKLPIINIPIGVSTFSKSVFNNCSSLKNVLLANPNAKYTLESRSFRNCTSLGDVTIASEHVVFNLDQETEHHAFQNDNQPEFKVWVRNEKVRDDLINPEKEAFYPNQSALLTKGSDFLFQANGVFNRLACLSEEGAKATKLTIPSNVTSINNFALTCCSPQLTDVTINGTKIAFDSYAFLNVPEKVTWHVANAAIKGQLMNALEHVGVKGNTILLPKAPLSAGAIAAIVSSVVILSIAGLAAGILIPMRKQHRINVLNSKLTNRRIDRLATSNAMAFKKVIEVTGEIRKDVNQIRALGPVTNQPQNNPPRRPRSFPPRGGR